jgi:glycosyltransferase involved in cell wall biosynthesis
LLPVYNHIIVSIIIPTYNSVGYLQRAIRSVMEQTFSFWELIVVDDGSSDDTVEMVHKIKDSRIRVIELSHTGNIGTVRNAGVESGCGQWITFLDADDEWLPDKLQIQLNCLSLREKCWGYGGYELIDEYSRLVPDKGSSFYPFSGNITSQILTCEAAVHLGSLMMQRSLFKKLGGFNTQAELLLREDYEFILRLSMCAEALAQANILLRVRMHESRTTTLSAEGHERTANVYHHFLQLHPEHSLRQIAQRRWAYHLAEIARNKITQGKYISAMKQLFKALVNHDHLRHMLSVIRQGFFRRQTFYQMKFKPITH